ncbi:hypothetical protein Q5752_004588 [Cryptotrichosporon argae]
MAYSQPPSYIPDEPDHAARPYDAPEPAHPQLPQPSTYRRARPRRSILDELLPIPRHDAGRPGTSVDALARATRRSAALGVVLVFLAAVVFLAATQRTHAHGSTGLSGIWTGHAEVMDVGGPSSPDGTQAESESLASEEAGEGIAAQDFDKYKYLHVVGASHTDIETEGKRVILIGDVHGSYQPLLRLMDAVRYDATNDTLIHVGDLVAKGDMTPQVLAYMREGNVLGVRGNHDQPVVQWRSWMEWGGGADWRDWVDGLPRDETAARSVLKKQGKLYPQKWKWQGEHWKIARNLLDGDYDYLVGLPLTLHLPSLHSIVVHAGLLPFDPSAPPSDARQPLVVASEQAAGKAPSGRTGEELSILAIPPNRDAWNLVNMRGLYEAGRHKGEVTKAGSKGTPWSNVWNREMMRCAGDGSWWADGMGELGTEKEDHEDAAIEGEEDAEVDETRSGKDHDLQCSPVTVIYGHAAGRGLDIKQFSKGIDTGCVYGRQLTALVLGDTTGLAGEPVRVDAHEGMLVSVECTKGGG